MGLYCQLGLAVDKGLGDGLTSDRGILQTGSRIYYSNPGQSLVNPANRPTINRFTKDYVVVLSVIRDGFCWLRVFGSFIDRRNQSVR